MVWVRKPEGKGALEISRRRWEENIETDLQKMERESGLKS